MARSIWKGSIGFGLVNIPVGLYPAEKRKELQFHLLDKRDQSPIRYQRVNEKTGKEVPWGQIERGYEYEDGHYVVLSDEDLKGANPEATQTVDITDFVDGAEISPVYFDKPYYLAPQKKGAKSYALLREALRHTGKVGIAKVVIRTKQYLAAVLPQDDLLVLNLLRFPHELRDAGEMEVPHGKEGITDKELQMAEKLVESMVDEWEPEKYSDTYEHDVLQMIEKRVKKGETAEVAPTARKAPEGKVVDLMLLLKRSVEQSGKAAKPAVRRPARRSAAAGRKSAARHRKSA
ncbi:MAG TPA: Ku protein [Thermoanaerobaculia bacterium]|nr:Ku protein [Thermoanaerobaculia bacterium]